MDMNTVPVHLQDWVREKQAILDRLLVEEPGAYVATRLKLQQEYEKLKDDVSGPQAKDT